MTRKGQIIKLKTALTLDVFKTYPIGGDWIVISGGKQTLATPVIQNHTRGHTDALKLDIGEFQYYFESTDRKGVVPVNVSLIEHSLAYQWNDFIRSQ